MSTTLLSGTTINNTAFGVQAGQRVELLIVNFNYSIPTDVITPEAIATYTPPLVQLSKDIADSDVLLARVQSFFAAPSPPVPTSPSATPPTSPSATPPSGRTSGVTLERGSFSISHGAMLSGLVLMHLLWVSFW